MNKIIVIGNLGRDPEMRYTPSGQTVTSFSVASNRRYTTNGEQREETEWFNVSAWGRLAETCNQYLTKGQQVYVEGRLSSRTYQANDGQTRFSNDIMLTDVQFLGSRGGGDQAPYGDDQGQGYGSGAGAGRGDSGQGYGGGYDRSAPNDPVDDLPF
jgi:single-strand DNA-binding protein